MNLEKKHILGWAIWAWSLVAFANNTSWVADSFNAFSSLATWIATWTKTLVTNILWTNWAAKLWACAPFAAPVVWWFAGYKLAEKVGIQSKLWRTTFWLAPWTVAWAALMWQWALLWPFAPLALAWGWLYMWYKWIKRLVSGWWWRPSPAPVPA